MISLIFFLNKIIAFIRTHVEKKYSLPLTSLHTVYPVFRRGGGGFLMGHWTKWCPMTFEKTPYHFHSVRYLTQLSSSSSSKLTTNQALFFDTVTLQAKVTKRFYNLRVIFHPPHNRFPEHARLKIAYAICQKKGQRVHMHVS